MTWEKETPLPSTHKGSLNCGPLETDLPMDSILAVGFGNVAVLKDGACVWSGDDPEKKVSEVEAKAAVDPDHDWRIEYNAPLYDAQYQRQGDGVWKLIKKGPGFA